MSGVCEGMAHSSIATSKGLFASILLPVTVDDDGW